MNDQQRLRKLNRARGHLRRTRQGYVQYAKDKRGSEWKAALALLEEVVEDLKGVRVPDLGPVWVGGKSVLEHDLTHATSGIPLYPAFDDAFNQGRVIVAPEPLTVTRASSSRPGLAFYATGKSKLRYWFGHLDRTHAAGTKFSKGASVGRVAANTLGGGPHVHVGINVELLLGVGKELAHRTNYTHGAPTVGEQLRRLLS